MIDLSNAKKVHIIGIEGAGTSSLARILKSLGKEVSGSDEGDHFFNSALSDEGIKVNHGFDAMNIPSDADVIIYGSSFKPETNEELKAAVESDVPVVAYAEALAKLFNEKYGIAVCGTHGKTTTSALLANTLKELGLDPQAVIGSKVSDWGSGALTGQGDIFVAEADEYQNKLRYYNPKSAILTSCDFDHPDYFKDFSEYKEAFANFVARIPQAGFLVVWGDSVDTLEVSEKCNAEVITYGFSAESDYVASDILRKGEFQEFEVEKNGKSLGKFTIRLVGKHNVLNATAVIAVCHKLNSDMDAVRKSVKNFRGISRRFEYVGERNGAVIIDDYAHHPEEIRATLKSAREIYPNKNIWAVFHPHTFTRTKALLSEFAQSFSDANDVVILDIYPSARETQGGVHSQDLVKLANRYDYGKAKYIAKIDEAADHIKNKIGKNDVVITLGAGNVWEIAEKLKEK